METIFLFLTIIACVIAAWWPLSFAVLYSNHTPAWMNPEDRLALVLESLKPGPFYAFLLSALWLLARVIA